MPPLDSAQVPLLRGPAWRLLSYISQGGGQDGEIRWRLKFRATQHSIDSLHAAARHVTRIVTLHMRTLVEPDIRSDVTKDPDLTFIVSSTSPFSSVTDPEGRRRCNDVTGAGHARY